MSYAIPKADGSKPRKILRCRSTSTFAIKEGDPHSGVWTQENMTGWKRGDWNCAVSAAFELTSEHEFHLKEMLLAKRDDKEIFKRETISGIERDLL